MGIKLKISNLKFDSHIENICQNANEKKCQNYMELAEKRYSKECTF